jgi:HSP20 family molecular chaperone IbpA
VNTNTGNREQTELAKTKDNSSKEIVPHVSRWHPRCDAEENEKEFIINAELPGLKKEDVKIEYDNDKHILRISGEV